MLEGAPKVLEEALKVLEEVLKDLGEALKILEEALKVLEEAPRASEEFLTLIHTTERQAGGIFQVDTFCLGGNLPSNSFCTSF